MLLRPMGRDPYSNVRKSTGQPIVQHRDHHVFGVKMPTVDQIDAKFGCAKKYVMLDIRSDKSVAAGSGRVLQHAAAASAADGYLKYGFLSRHIA